MTPTPNSVRSTPVVGHQHRWLIAILSVAASTAFAQQGDGNDVPIKTHVFNKVLDRAGAHGLAIRDGQLYVATVK